MLVDALLELSLAELTAMRTDAVRALASLSSGAQASYVMVGDRAVTYTKANAADLRAWIADLSAAIRSVSLGQSPIGPVVPEY